MEAFEFQGKTPEEAIEAACLELNLTKEEFEIEIIDPGSTGIFGLVGGRKSRIKVTVNKKEEQVDPDNDQAGLSIAKETLENILRLMPIEDTVVNEELDDVEITLRIEGEKSGILIGRKGRTLDALQFIVSKIVNKSLGKRTQVVIDSENYRERRKEYLSQTALKLGEKSIQIKKPVSTDLLNPNDRRIVHMALRNKPDLDTRSKGDGFLKRVVIFPKR
jgi:spoIIIJ-associated protein